VCVCAVSVSVPVSVSIDEGALGPGLRGAGSGGSVNREKRR
jgi:hypothetical protein